MNTSDTHQLEKSAPQGQQAAGKRKDTDYGDGLDLSKKATPTREQPPSQTSSNPNDPSQNLEQQQQQNPEGYPNKRRLNCGNLAVEQATSDLPVASTSAQSQQNLSKRRSKKSKTKMDDLDDDSLMRIFTMLNTEDRTRGERVSKRWNELIARVWSSEKSLDLWDNFASTDSCGRLLEMPILRQILKKCPNLRKLYLPYKGDWVDTELIAEACPLLEVVDLRGYEELEDYDLLILGERLPHLKRIQLRDSFTFTDDGICAFLEANSAASALTVGTSLAKGLESLDLENCDALTGRNMFPETLPKCPRGLKWLRIYGSNQVDASILIRDLIHLRSQEENPPNSTPAFPLTRLRLNGARSDTLTLVTDHFADTLISLNLQNWVYSDESFRGIENVHRLRSLESLRLTTPPLVGLTNTVLNQILLELRFLRVLKIDCTPPDDEDEDEDEDEGEGEDEDDEPPAGDAAPAEPDEPGVISDEGVAPITLALCSPNLKVIALPNSQVSGAALRQFTWLEHLRALSLKGCRTLDDESLVAFFNETSSISSLREFDLNGCSSLTANGVRATLEAFRARAPPESKDSLDLLWDNESFTSRLDTIRDDIARLKKLHVLLHTDVDRASEYEDWLECLAGDDDGDL